MKIVFTKHALGKFKHPSIVKLGIKRVHIKQAVTLSDYSSETKEKKTFYLYSKILIVTFHPTEKGRYED